MDLHAASVRLDLIQLGANTAAALARDDLPHAKLVFNDRGFIACWSPIQHDTMKAEGISNEDNYRGNAMAAVLKPDAIEIRYHAALHDASVARLLQ